MVGGRCRGATTSSKRAGPFFEREVPRLRGVRPQHIGAPGVRGQLAGRRIREPVLVLAVRRSVEHHGLVVDEPAPRPLPPRSFRSGAVASAIGIAEALPRALCRRCNRRKSGCGHAVPATARAVAEARSIRRPSVCVESKAFVYWRVRGVRQGTGPWGPNPISRTRTRLDCRGGRLAVRCT